MSLPLFFNTMFTLVIIVALVALGIWIQSKYAPKFKSIGGKVGVEYNESGGARGFWSPF